MIPWWGILLFIVFAFIAEMISTFCFNFKIILTKHERFLLSSIFGSIATMVYILFTSLSVYFGVSSDQIYITIIALFFLAVGNFFSTIIFNKLDKQGTIEKIVSDDFEIKNLFKKSFWVAKKPKRGKK